MARIKSSWKKTKITLLLLVMFLFSILALELLLRLVPEPRFASNWVFDPLVGYHGPKNTLVDHAIENKTRYNSYGYRGENPTPLEHRGEIFSVSLLGDSFTEAIQNPWRRSYAKQLEYLLSHSLGRDTEVTSWAYSDYGTTQAFLIHDLWAKHQKPDLVLLQFLGINDYVNNGVGFAEKNKALGDFMRPYMIPPGSDLPLHAQYLDIPVTFRNPEQKYWMEKSRLFHIFNALKHIRAWAEKNAYLNSEEGLSSCEVELEVFLTDQSQAWQQSYEVTYRLARALKESVEKEGKAKFAAVYFPSFYEVFPLVWERSFQPKIHRCFPGKAYDRMNPERRFHELFAKAGVRTFSLREAFLHSRYPIPQIYLPDGHLSAEGHRVTAEAIQGFLIREKLIPFSPKRP